MEEIDKLFIRWINQNIDNFVWRGAKRKWDAEEVIKWVGWPSEHRPEPYLEDIQHVLNDHEYDLGIPIPKIFLAYRASLWCDNNVTTSDELILNYRKLREIWFKSEYDEATKEEEIYLHDTVAKVAKGELAENLGDRDELLSYLDASTIGSKDRAPKYYIFETNGEIYRILTDDNLIGIMNEDGVIKVFDYEGNKLDVNTDRIFSTFLYFGRMGGTAFTDKNELASIVGNQLAELISGDSGFSIMDLPD